MSLFLSPTNRRDANPGANHATGDVSVTSQFWGFVTGLWTDWRREVRIRELRFDISVAHAYGRTHDVRRIAERVFAECDARSPRQVARMEKRILDRMDAHSRVVFERARNK